jgi:hypothetical protein
MAGRRGSSRGVRAGCCAAAFGLMAAVGAPAAAATPVAQASATAVRLTIGGTPVDSGTYSVTHDGTSQSAHGSNRPQVTALGGQQLVSAGTLAQDASTSVDREAGVSRACAGLAGDGATLVAVGEGSCLSGGHNLQVGAGSLDLGQLQIVSSTLLQGLDQQLQTALQPVLGQVLPALQTGLQAVLSQAGDLQVVLDLGALQSSCRAGGGSAQGDASLADSAAYVSVAGQRVDLLALPAHPAPNTKVVTNLDKVVQLLLDDLRAELGTALTGALAPLNGVVDQGAVLTNVVQNLAQQLAPLEQNVLEATLNKQERPSSDSIAVTALDLTVLPAAAQLGVDLFHLEVGVSSCGPNGRIAAPAPTPTPTATPTVPTSVPAGAPSAAALERSSGQGSGAGWALAGLLLVATGCGLATWRRTARR